MSIVHINNYNKISWQCRRGMLELDEILMNFFRKHYADLNEAMQVSFMKLLQESDAKLFDYFFTKELPNCNHLKELVLIINRNRSM